MKPSDDDVYEAVRWLLAEGMKPYLYRVRAALGSPNDSTYHGGFRLVPALRRLEQAGRLRVVRGGISAFVEMAQAAT